MVFPKLAAGRNVAAGDRKAAFDRVGRVGAFTMRERSKAARHPSTLRPATSGGKSRNKLRKIHPAIAVFLRAHAERIKPAAILADLTGASRSFCEKVLDGRSAPGPDMLEALIFSAIGRDVLRAMAAARAGDLPAWWRDFIRESKRGEIRSEIRRLQLELDNEER